MKTIEDFIDLNAKLYGDKTAIISAEKRFTYAELNRMVNEYTDQLEASHVAKGSIVTLRASQSIKFLLHYFAIHRYGCVAAPMEHDMPETQYNNIAGWLASCSVPAGSADILYTTGTTGKSKGVIVSHRAIIADAENLIEAQGFSHDLAFIVNGPLNHIGSLSKVYPVMMMGATLIITKGMKDTQVFFNALDWSASKIATFLVPASIRILIQFSSDRLSLYRDKIDFIETGGAPIMQSDMEYLANLLPNTRLYNTYASTETGIICTHNYNGNKCVAGCLGKPMKHSKVIITEDGRVACQGATLMSGYVDDVELTKSVLMNDTVYTQDIGYIDDDGMLRLSGRQDDVINVGGFKVAPSEVENVAIEIPEIIDCVCIASSHPVIGTALKLLIVLEDGTQLDKKKIAQHIKSKIEGYKVPFAYEQVDSIHRTYNGKINRKYYR